MSRKLFSPRFLMGSILILTLPACGGAAATPAPATEFPAATEAPAMTEAPEATASPSVLPTQAQPAETSIAATSTPGQPEFPIISVPQPEIPERRRLTLEYPARIRAGDSDIIRLTLEVDKNGNITPTAVVGGNVVTGQTIEIPNLYESHHVSVEARFDAAGIEVSPAGLSSQTLLPGQTVMFFWSIRPLDVGIYRGTVWVNLRFVDKVSGEESQRVVSAQLVEIEAVNLLGIPVNVVRTVGGVGSVVGAIIGFPFFEDIVKFVFKKRRKIAA